MKLSFSAMFFPPKHQLLAKVDESNFSLHAVCLHFPYTGFYDDRVLDAMFASHIYIIMSSCLRLSWRQRPV